MRRAIEEDSILSYPYQAAVEPVANGTPVAGALEAASSEDLLERIVTSLTDDKAEDVVSIDLRGRSEMADYMVIASGRSTRQVSALSDKLTGRLKQDLALNCRVEGKDQGDWVLVDAGDVIVHVFRPEVREFYQLEKMWQPSGAFSA